MNTSPLLKWQENTPEQSDQIIDLNGAVEMTQNLELSNQRDLSTNINTANLSERPSVPSNQIESIFNRAFEIDKEMQLAKEVEAAKARLAIVQERVNHILEISHSAQTNIADVLKHATESGLSEDAILRALDEFDQVGQWNNERINLARSLKLPDEATPEVIENEMLIRKQVEKIKGNLDSILRDIRTKPLEYQKMSTELHLDTSINKLEAAFETRYNLAHAACIAFYAIPIVGWVLLLAKLSNGEELLSRTWTPKLDKPTSPALIELQNLVASKGAYTNFNLNSDYLSVALTLGPKPN